jgi:hypothetical protein
VAGLVAVTSTPSPGAWQSVLPKRRCRRACPGSHTAAMLPVRCPSAVD